VCGDASDSLVCVCDALAHRKRALVETAKQFDFNSITGAKVALPKGVSAYSGLRATFLRSDKAYDVFETVLPDSLLRPFVVGTQKAIDRAVQAGSLHAEISRPFTLKVQRARVHLRFRSLTQTHQRSRVKHD